LICIFVLDIYAVIEIFDVVLFIVDTHVEFERLLRNQ